MLSAICMQTIHTFMVLMKLPPLLIDFFLKKLFVSSFLNMLIKLIKLNMHCTDTSKFYHLKIHQIINFPMWKRFLPHPNEGCAHRTKATIDRLLIRHNKGLSDFERILYQSTTNVTTLNWISLKVHLLRNIHRKSCHIFGQPVKRSE